MAEWSWIRMSSLDYSERFPQFYAQPRLAVQTVWAMKQISFNRKAFTSSHTRLDQIFWKMYFCSRQKWKMKTSWVWFLGILIKWSQSKVKRVRLSLQRSKNWYAFSLQRVSLRICSFSNHERKDRNLKLKRKY